jgi:hypothetical protein
LRDCSKTGSTAVVGIGNFLSAAFPGKLHEQAHLGIVILDRIFPDDVQVQFIHRQDVIELLVVTFVDAARADVIQREAAAFCRRDGALIGRTAAVIGVGTCRIHMKRVR